MVDGEVLAETLVVGIVLDSFVMIALDVIWFVWEDNGDDEEDDDGNDVIGDVLQVNLCVAQA